MGSLNQASIIGNLGRDAELRYTPGETAVASFSVATTEHWTDKSSGEKKEATEWHRCVLWGKSAEALSTYLVKGKQVFVQGRLQTRKWTDREQMERQTTEIRVDKVVLLGGGKGGHRTEGDAGDDQRRRGADDGGAQEPMPIDDSDITF